MTSTRPSVSAQVRPSANDRHILIVEDDAATRHLLSRYLASNGFSVMEAASFASASRLLSVMRFAAVVLDLQLEDGDGLEILKSGNCTPDATIVISARSDSIDRINGLELGADDYLPKPIEPRELLLRLNRSLQRKASAPSTTSITVDEENAIRLDLLERALYRNTEFVAALRNREFRVLRLLLENMDDVISRTFISREILGRRVVGESRAVDMLVSSVRRKLLDCNASLTLRSVRGEGYALIRKQEKIPKIS
jgi:two-component system response regulator CpxR